MGDCVPQSKSMSRTAPGSELYQGVAPPAAGSLYRNAGAVLSNRYVNRVVTPVALPALSWALRRR